METLIIAVDAWGDAYAQNTPFAFAPSDQSARTAAIGRDYQGTNQNQRRADETAPYVFLIASVLASYNSAEGCGFFLPRNGDAKFFFMYIRFIKYTLPS